MLRWTSAASTWLHGSLSLSLCLSPPLYPSLLKVSKDWSGVSPAASLENSLSPCVKWPGCAKARAQWFLRVVVWYLISYIARPSCGRAAESWRNTHRHHYSFLAPLLRSSFLLQKSKVAVILCPYPKCPLSCRSWLVKARGSKQEPRAESKSSETLPGHG